MKINRFPYYSLSVHLTLFLHLLYSHTHKKMFSSPHLVLLLQADNVKHIGGENSSSGLVVQDTVSMCRAITEILQCYITIPYKNQSFFSTGIKPDTVQSSPVAPALKLLLGSPAVTSKHCCAASFCVYV